MSSSLIPAAVVILYHPGEESLQNIRSYLPQVSRLYVYDNTEQPIHGLQPLLADPRVHWHHDGENRGLAERLNAAAVQALADGARWLLTMDQDSSFALGVLEQYLQSVAQYPGSERVAMFGLNFGEHEFLQGVAPKSVSTPHLITSGSLLQLSTFGAVGGFDEALFIDGVDHDYCVAARYKGYDTVQFPGLTLQHSIGATVHRACWKTLYLGRKQKRIHSPLRCYYMQRNALYLLRKWKADAPLEAKCLHDLLMSNVRNNRLYGRHGLALRTALKEARRDFAAGRFGKKVD